MYILCRIQPSKDKGNNITSRKHGKDNAGLPV